MIKRITALFVSLIFIFGISVPVMADAPFQGFSYDFWGRYIPAPAAYIPVATIGGRDIDSELGNFVNPTDIGSDRYGNIYLMDSGNNRLVIFDRSLNLIRVIDSFVRDGAVDTFNSPNGVFVSDDMRIHIADTENRRVVTLDQEGNFIRLITQPEFDALEDAVDFRPIRVVVDRGGRVFVTVHHVFEGIMSFNPYGEFMGYFGTIEVIFNPIDMLWRFLSTEEQRARQALFIPTEFAGMDIDDYGFVFATNRSPFGDNMVQRLNPRGENVLVNLNDNVEITGSQTFQLGGPFGGPAIFVDVAARPYGKYSVLDSVRGRVYTYDSEGNLLYTFSGTGSIVGMSRNPVAIETLGDSILILDGQRGQILYFEPTEYGSLINSAIANRYIGNEAAAILNWQRLLEIDEHFILAHAGIGQSLLAAGENRLAMEYLRRGMNVRYYSVALRRYRNEVLHGSINYILTGGLIAVLAISGFRMRKRFKKGGEKA